MSAMVIDVPVFLDASVDAEWLAILRARRSDGELRMTQAEWDRLSTSYKFTVYRNYRGEILNRLWGARVVING